MDLMNISMATLHSNNVLLLLLSPQNSSTDLSTKTFLLNDTAQNSTNLWLTRVLFIFREIQSGWRLHRQKAPSIPPQKVGVWPCDD